MLCSSVSFSLGVLSVVELRRSSALLLLSCSFHLSILLVFAFCILKSWLFSTCVRCLYLCHYLLCVWIDPFIIVKIFFFLSLVTPPLLISSSMWLTQHELNGFFVDFFFCLILFCLGISCLLHVYFMVSDFVGFLFYVCVSCVFPFWKICFCCCFWLFLKRNRKKVHGDEWVGGFGRGWRWGTMVRIYYMKKFFNKNKEKHYF